MFIKRIKLLLIIFAILNAYSLLGNLFAAEEEDLGPRVDLFKIDSIDVVGLKKVEKEAILEKISSKEGLILDNYLLRKDIKKIYSLKYFDHVEVHKKTDQGKNRLIFVVKEKPIISKINIEGNSEINDEDVLGQVKTKEFAILDVSTIKSDVSAVSKFYEEKGFYLASVRYEIQEVSNETVELNFKIQEYDKVRVKKVIFLGNRSFSDDELKEIMETREENLFSFMSNSGNFKEFNFQTDIERLKYFYKTKGFLQINVGTPEVTVSEDKKWVFITVKLTEGPQFTVNEITFQGEMLFPESDLYSKIALKKGVTYSEEDLRKDIQLLTEMYQDEGYAFANVLRTLHPVPGENKVDIEFSFEKGKIAYFGNINMKGNTKTRDKVIRRELLIREGMKYSGTAMRKSKENVNRLGFFEPSSVLFNTVTPKGRDDVLDVEIQVKERNTGQISLGAGYSTASGAFIQGSIAQNNFRGLGQNLSFSLMHSSTNQTFNLGFVEPYLMDSKWTLGGDLFRTNNKASESYSYKREGFDVRVGHPIWEYAALYVTYKFEDTKISSLNDPTVEEDLENGIASSVRTSIVHDERDNKFEPSNGFYTSASTEYAGLGGEKKWYRHELDGRYFKRVWGDLVLRSRLFMGRMDQVDDKRIPRTEKYTLGGSRNLRGYDFEAIGPKKVVYNPVTGLPYRKPLNDGGQFSTFGQFEFEHPLAREAGLKWVLFMDAGNVYRKYLGEGGDYGFKYDYGFGFRWFSPIGVLRFEFGYPLNPGPNDRGSQFHFDIGQLF